MISCPVCLREPVSPVNFWVSSCWCGRFTATSGVHTRWMFMPASTHQMIDLRLHGLALQDGSLEYLWSEPELVPQDTLKVEPVPPSDREAATAASVRAAIAIAVLES